MNATLFRGFVVLTIVLGWGGIVMGQGDCPTIIRQALEIADTACDATGRNQACYGNVTLNAVPQAGVSDFKFAEAGDLVNVADVQRLTLSTFDVSAEQWGIALMKIQANIPDTLPGQNVTFLLFGDVEIQNTGGEITEATTSSAGESPTFGPMQAFVFKSGFHDSPCSEAPDSGILIQSPEGAGVIQLKVNGVDISLGSTAYLQAQPNGEMTIHVVEGYGTVSAFDRTVAVPAGTRVRIPLGADIAATGAPSDPEAYDDNAITALPYHILPDAISPVSPLSSENLLALNAPTAGFWILTYDSEYIDVGCAADTYNSGYATELTYNDDGSILWKSITLYPSGYGVYDSLPNPGATSSRSYTMTVISSSQIEGVNTLIVSGCATIVNRFHLVLESAF